MRVHIELLVVVFLLVTCDILADPMSICAGEWESLSDGTVRATKGYLAIPTKKAERRPVGYLTRTEVDALLAAPDVPVRWGRRDYALLLFALQTGFRVSEIAQLKHGDVHLGVGAHVRCLGKGRKQRCTPIQAQALQALKAWLVEQAGLSTDPIFYRYPVSCPKS